MGYSLDCVCYVLCLLCLRMNISCHLFNENHELTVIHFSPTLFGMANVGVSLSISWAACLVLIAKCSYNAFKATICLVLLSERLSSRAVQNQIHSLNRLNPILPNLFVLIPVPGCPANPITILLPTCPSSHCIPSSPRSQDHLLGMGCKKMQS